MGMADRMIEHYITEYAKKHKCTKEKAEQTAMVQNYKAYAEKEYANYQGED